METDGKEDAFSPTFRQRSPHHIPHTILHIATIDNITSTCGVRVKTNGRTDSSRPADRLTIAVRRACAAAAAVAVPDPSQRPPDAR